MSSREGSVRPSLVYNPSSKLATQLLTLSNLTGISATAQDIWHPAYGKLLAGSTRMTPVSRFYGVDSTWRHYEEIFPLPERLIIMADSLCCLSPVYGQGMAIAAMEAAELDKLLQRRQPAAAAVQSVSVQNGVVSCGEDGNVVSAASNSSKNKVQLEGLTEEFLLQAASPILKRCWMLSAGKKTSFQGATSTEPKPALAGFMRQYINTMYELAPKDMVVNEALARVMTMYEPPETLLQPAVLGRVLLRMLTSALTKGLVGRGTTNAAPMASVKSARARCEEAAAEFDLGLDGRMTAAPMRR
eukprot:GHRR01011420.1.p1 GENE.GHRR01011420.1~~GHRR01011420.1.p1  ORF type:complete len:301 (+),score=105.30 GHRR01011420.1:2264-3166(+)